MTTTTTVAIVESGIEALTAQFTALLPIIIPVVIAVAVMFAAWRVVKGLAHRR